VSTVVVVVVVADVAGLAGRCRIVMRRLSFLTTRVGFSVARMARFLRAAGSK